MPSEEIAAEPPVWSVAALTRAIKRQLEGQFLRVTVQGEISNGKLHPSGHFYFTLKDSEAQISAVLFRTQQQQLGFIPQNGDQVVVDGALNVYPAGGRYQLVIRSMRRQGLGELLLRLEALKRKLHAKGWFNQEQKKKLPLLPKTIGVVTSPSGAVIQDILQVLERRVGQFHLILYPVKVQGEGAAEEIAAAIHFFSSGQLPVDVLLVGRGGGSMEDLWCFNEEVVAQALFECAIPTICAVGHESDHSIAEYVADVRAPTPSAAAELVMAEKQTLQKQLKQLEQRWHQAICQKVRQRRQRLTDLLKQPLFFSPKWLLSSYLQRLDELALEPRRRVMQRLSRHKLQLAMVGRTLRAREPSAQIAAKRRQLGQLQKQLEEAFQRKLSSRRRQLAELSRRHDQQLLIYRRQALSDGYARLNDRQRQIEGWARKLLDSRRTVLSERARTLAALDPKRPLERGYWLVTDGETGNLLSATTQLTPGQLIQATMRHGHFSARIEQIVHGEST